MTRNELVASLILSGFYRGSWDLDDDDYSAVSEGFIAAAHLAWLESLPMSLLTQRDVGGGKTVTAVKWLPETWDCDNIARDFGCFLGRCMAADAAQTRKPWGNIAAGKFNFAPAPGTSHAVNWFVDHDGKAHCFDAAVERQDHIPPDQLATISAGESI